MALATHLVDTSALNRMTQPSVEAVLAPLLERALVATCATLNLEALFSARDPRDYVQLSNWRNATMEYVGTEEVHLERAQEVQAELARTGRHRSVTLPDLIMAAVAEQHQLTLLHNDQDFDVISSITDQDCQWVVPRGSVP